MIRVSAPNSLPPASPDELCRSWCEHLGARVVDDSTLEVVLPGSWLGEERIRCYVERRARDAVVTDMGGIFGELWTRGVHRSGHVAEYARALGFTVGPHRELSRSAEGASDIASAIAELAQIASLALAELLRIEFAAPAMVVTDAWTNLLVRNLSDEPDAEVEDVHQAAIDPQRVIRRAVLARYRGEPLVVSPVITGDARGEYAKLYYLAGKAPESVRGIFPLVRTKHEGLTPTMIDELSARANENGRMFDIVQVRSEEERFSLERHAYPAMAKIEAGADRFARMFREVQKAA